MKVLQINTVYKNGGSTGRIVYDISQLLKKEGIESYVGFGYEYQKTDDAGTFRMESIPELKWSILKTRIFARHGFYNKRQTKKLIRWIDAIQPDIIHLHNLHNHYLNVEILFNYLKKKDIPVVWTLHDCWPFTGWCAYFDYSGCDRWKTGCGNCPSLHDYPKTLFWDRSADNFHDKKRIFTGVNNLTIVTPSEWLHDLAKQSFLGNYNMKVINNGVDLTRFWPGDSLKTHSGSFKILGVADKWGRRKGLKYFLELRDRLPKEEYGITLIGLSEEQIAHLPEGIVGVRRTDSVEELAEYYRNADVFVNPTLEDNFPTTNLEALACGTPVITFETGGSPETLTEKTGIAVKKGNIDELEAAIRSLKEHPLTSRDCCERAAKRFDKYSKYREYITLYKELARG